VLHTLSQNVVGTLSNTDSIDRKEFSSDTFKHMLGIFSQELSLAEESHKNACDQQKMKNN
jgi:hypothetical protein